jgi:ubiquitin-protein ligase
MTLNPRVLGRVNKELKELMNSAPEGVRFVPNDMDTLTEVHVEMDGPGTIIYNKLIL